MKNFGHTFVLALLLLVGSLIAFPGDARGDQATPPSDTPVAVAQIIVEKSDLDGNPIANVLITVTPDDVSRPAMQSRTNALGQAIFAGIPLGRYTVTETVPAGQVPVTTTTRKVHLAVAGQTTTVTFVNDWAFTIDGYTLNDLGHALPGWTIVASNSETNKVFRAVSDQSGYFRFDQVTAGTWTVNEVVQPGWTAVTSSTITVTVTADASPAAVHFTNRTPCAMLDVVVLSDATTRAGVSGVEITVQPGSGASLTGRTGSSGRVHFTCLPPGEYSIDETIPTGWLALTRHPLQVLVEASGTPLVVTFRVRQEVARATPSAQPAKPSPAGVSTSPIATPMLIPTVTFSARASVTPALLPVATVGATSLPALITPGTPAQATPPPSQAITVSVPATLTQGPPTVVATSLPVLTPPSPSLVVTASPPALTTPRPSLVVTATPPVLATPSPSLVVTATQPVLTTPSPSLVVTATLPVLTAPSPSLAVTATQPALTAPSPSLVVTATLPALTAPSPSLVVTTSAPLSITTPTAAPICRVKYLIRWGDTLSRIAARYHTTVKDLMTANNLRSTTIYAGRQLCIP